MREVKVAKSAGFCFGVKRAVDMVEKQLDAAGDGLIYTYGPIIHNESVVASLEAKGVRVMDEDGDPADYPAGTVFIRAHGVSRRVEESIKAAGHRVVDATCPFVKKIHRMVEEYSKKGYVIVITGDAAHPEVRGIMGWAEGPVECISSYEEYEALGLLPDKKVCLVSQTTFNYEKFKELVEKLEKNRYNICAKNTICLATEERQKEARVLAGEVDAMIVIGGRSSSNSKKLFDICSAVCRDTYFIQSMSDLDTSSLSSIEYVGITAGASTPNNIIEEVQKNVRNEL